LAFFVISEAFDGLLISPDLPDELAMMLESSGVSCWFSFGKSYGEVDGMLWWRMKGV
jgi:hypothetical protein